MMSARAGWVLSLFAFSVLLYPGELSRAETNDALRQRGIEALQAKNFAVARQTFVQLVQLEPSADNYNYLATAEAASGQVDLAMAYLQKSIQLGNRTASAYYNLGILEMQAHKVDDAITQFRLALNRDPRHLPARYGLGVALVASGRPREAVEMVEKTLALAPHEERFWALLVNAQFAAGDSPKAVASTQSALQDFPDDARLDVTLATLCLRYGVAQRARELLEDATELIPNDPDVDLLLAKASLKAGEPDEALAVLQGMAPADRKGKERLLLLGETRALLGDLKSAADDLGLLLDDNPRDPECLVAYAWLQNLQGHFEAAIASLTKAHYILPRAPWILYGMGVSYYYLGKYGQTESACQEALQLDPKYTPAYMLRGIANLKEKRFEAARIDFAKAVELAPDNLLSHRELGIALYDSGKTTLAGEQFDFALRRDGKDVDSYFWRAKSLQAQGEVEKAIADLNTVIALKPGYADAYTELARIYSETGHADQAAIVLAHQKQQGASSQPSEDDTLLHNLPDATH